MMLLVVLLEVEGLIQKMELEMAVHVAFVIVGGADGRCISLLKILMSNACIYDCKYCINRCSNSVKRATFTPREIADLTINFYKRNYIEGLFLSSAVIKNPDYTMERLYETIFILRKEYKFNGYIHVKTIPGASKELIDKLGVLVDRTSINIELPSNDSLKLLAPQKEKAGIVTPMKYISQNIAISKQEKSKYKEKFVPARANYTINCRSNTRNRFKNYEVI